ncbi:hypothetical protein ACF1G0_33965 [Streptomyces sp. NPDC013953]|uniref:hypothetical protein n=1 Tax=Streptomyces sp. NPDC013953 TaxID=3364868 RepID=UPI0036FED4A2
MELTEAGQALPGEARRTLHSAAAAREAVAAVRGVVGGTPTVGTGQWMGAVDPLGGLVAFGARHPPWTYGWSRAARRCCWSGCAGAGWTWRRGGRGSGGGRA